MRYRYRRGRWGWGGFPIPLFFILFFIWGHSWFAFLVSAGIMILLFLLVRGLMSASTRSGAWGAPPTMNQPYNQPYQEPYQPYQQQDYPSYNEPPYQPYQQGYQAPQRGYEQGEPEYRYPEQLPERSENVQYEQPQAQYPEELPPMRQ